VFSRMRVALGLDDPPLSFAPFGAQPGGHHGPRPDTPVLHLLRCPHAPASDNASVSPATSIYAASVRVAGHGAAGHRETAPWPGRSVARMLPSYPVAGTAAGASGVSQRGPAKWALVRSVAALG
jgi:hypothetical protein